MLTKTKSYKHQATIIEQSKDHAGAGYFMEQGTGKTHVTIGVATHLFLQGKIDVVLVLAPNGVHSNWAINEIPAHSPLPLERQEIAVWSASDGIRKRNRFEEQVKEAGGSERKLTYVLANIEALRTKAFIKLVEDHILRASIFDDPTQERLRFMMVIDESTVIKNPKADVTKAAWKIGDHALYRRILTGTPISQGPMDLYAQCRFLGRNVLPYNSMTAFKHDYVIEQPVNLGPGRPAFNKVVGYRNQDKLARMIEPFTWRVLKKDCLDLPEKIYQTRYVELTPEQKRIYKQLVQTSMTALEQDGQMTTVTALTAITVMLRCQQVTLGYITDDNKKLIQIESNRINALTSLIEEMAPDAKAIIFCRFKEDVRRVVESLSPGNCVEYHGDVGDAVRSENVRAFQEDPTKRWFVATSAAARGLTLTAASAVIYYSQGFSLDTRLQSEDRAHRIGQTKNVVYTNLVARGTVDEKVIQRLMQKQDIANQVLTREQLQGLLALED
jgi:SNF2 family DNA or RNA helicase